MLLRAVVATLVLVAANLALPGSNPAQQKSEPTSSGFNADYPSDEDGVLIQDGEWLALSQESPTKSRVKHGAAARLPTARSPPPFLRSIQGSIRRQRYIWRNRSFVSAILIFSREILYWSACTQTPNMTSASSTVAGCTPASSMVSCKSPAAIVSGSMPIAASR